MDGSFYHLIVTTKRYISKWKIFSRKFVDLLEVRLKETRGPSWNRVVSRTVHKCQEQCTPEGIIKTFKEKEMLLNPLFIVPKLLLLGLVKTLPALSPHICQMVLQSLIIKDQYIDLNPLVSW